MFAARARERALPACVERLGEAACREHLAANHEDCARLTYHPPQRLSPHSYQDDAAYLECVVAGVNAWVEDNGAKREQAERARRVYDVP